MKAKFGKNTENIEITCTQTGEVVKGYNNYLQTQHWKSMRKQAAEHFEYTCIRCNSVFKESYHIHHNTYKRLGNEKLSDLSFYCNKCHTIIHKNKDERKTFNKQYNTLISSKLSKLNEEQIEKVISYIDQLVKEK